MKTEPEALPRECPLCDRPSSSIVELPGDLGYQVLHQCPDGHAKAVSGKTHQEAIDTWNFYCELNKKKTDPDEIASADP
jgi:hypothetical protein